MARAAGILAAAHRDAFAPGNRLTEGETRVNAITRRSAGMFHPRKVARIPIRRMNHRGGFGVADCLEDAVRRVTRWREGSVRGEKRLRQGSNVLWSSTKVINISDWDTA
jgi:hypothetical protein